MTEAAWSTIKVPIAARVIADAGGPSGISDAQRALIERALTVSDNAAADELWAELAERHGGGAGAAGAVGEILRSAGDSTTVVSTQGRDGFSPYGQTDWSLAEQQRFIGAMAGGRLDESAGADYLLGLMGDVTAAQRWGLGSVGLPARFKGGWGPGSDGRYLVRQMGVLDLPDGQLAVALAARAEDGTEVSGTAMLDELAARLAAS